MNPPTISTDKAARGSISSLSNGAAGRLIASHDRELLTQMPRILELTSAALRSYGGNYADYQQQRELEQQAARAALEHGY
jgi:ATPase subunit of ABC transporter with duplicated ATPase domains